MTDNQGWWQSGLSVLRDNPYLRLDFSSLFTGNPDEPNENEAPIMAPASAQNTKVIYANLNFGRPATKHTQNKNEMKRQGALIIPTVEDESTPNREWVWVSQRISHTRLRKIPAFQSKHGAQVGDRDIVWRNCTIPGFRKRITIAVAHAPHPRMGDAIYEDFARQIHKAIRSFEDDWCLFGDWNKLLRNDPCNLEARYPGGVWRGERIDGVRVSKGIVDKVKVRAIPQPQRKDNHPWIELTFEP